MWIFYYFFLLKSVTSLGDMASIEEKDLGPGRLGVYTFWDEEGGKRVSYKILE